MLWLRLVRGTELADGVRTEALVAGRTGRFTIGRDPVCDWHIPDRTRSVSARHCEIALGTRPMLRDLSTNGTFVNGASTRLDAEHALRAGDRLVFGPYLIEVHAAPPQHAAPALPVLDTPLTMQPPRPAAPPPAADGLTALADGLGLDAQRLGPEAFAQAGLLLRQAIEGLRRQLEAQAALRTRIASRPLLVPPALAPAASADDTLAALLDGGADGVAWLAQAQAALAAHDRRLVAALRAASRRLAAEEGEGA